MKLLDIKQLKETTNPKAGEMRDLLDSIKDGIFTKDGTHLPGIYFDFSHSNLKSLKGSPLKAKGDYLCSNNRLTSLEGAPKIIKGKFWANNNLLTSLKGGPDKVEGFFNCDENRLKSLEGAPDYVGSYFSCENNMLVSLVGAPKITVNDFYCNFNKLTSLEGVSSSLGGSLYCHNNSLTSLKDIHKHLKSAVSINVEDNPIKSHVLGLLKIKSLGHVYLDNKKVEEIINRHLRGTERDIFACQQELIDAGFEEFAQL